MIICKKNKQNLEVLKGQVNKGLYKVMQIQDLYFLDPIFTEKKSNYYSNKDLFDYIVCDNENKAKEISKKYLREIKLRLILGIKGFDGKYYILNKNFYETNKKIILNIKRDIFSLDEILEKTKVNNDAIKGVLEIMKEEGLIFEKRKNAFKLVM